MAKDGGAEIPRDPRFSLVVPMVYRHPRDDEWQEGTTVNVSGSGALFVGLLGLQPGAPIELRLALRSAAPGVAPDSFYCTGRIMRVAPGSAEPGGTMMAAQFDDFRFEHNLTAH